MEGQGLRLDTSKIGQAKQAQFMREAVRNAKALAEKMQKLEAKVTKLSNRVKALEKSNPVQK